MCPFDLGCDVNATNWMNVTALSIATRMKDERLWKILFKNGSIKFRFHTLLMLKIITLNLS